jgi:hypothetical protein
MPKCRACQTFVNQRRCFQASHCAGLAQMSWTPASDMHPGLDVCRQFCSDVGYLPDTRIRFTSLSSLQKKYLHFPEALGGYPMPLIQVLVALIVVGVLLWLVNTYIPMQSTIKSILNGVVVIVVVLWLLNVFGVIHSLTNIRVGN